MGLFITIFLLFYLNLLVFPVSILGFEPPKVLVSELLILLIFVNYLIKKKKTEVISINRVGIFLILGLVGLSIYHLFRNFNFIDLFGNIFRLQGIILLWFLSLFAVVSSPFKLDDRYRTAFLIALLYLVSAALIFGNNPAGRAIGTLGEPNALAASAVFIFPFIYYFYKKIFPVLVAFVITAIVIILTQSASGLLGFIVEMVFIFLNQKMKLSFAKSAIVSCLLLIISLSLPFLNISLGHTKPASQFENRSLIWQSAIYAGEQYPLFGSGFGSVQDRLGETSKHLNNTLQYVVVDSSHNFLLDYWVESGVSGLLLITSLIMLVFKNMIQKKAALEITAFLGVISVMLFNPVSVITLLSFWWLIGQGLSQKED